MQLIEVQHAKLPMLGLGTWQLHGAECQAAVEEALALGYRHIDTAQAYENEAEVGRALKASKVPRAEVWVTTKIWTSNMRAAEVERSTHESLDRLGLDAVDLLLIHWPSRDVPLEETLRACERLQKSGQTRFIGVSNFPSALMREAKTLAPGIINNQVELHPYLTQPLLRKEAQRLSVVLTAYSPLARGRVGKDDILINIARAHGKTPVQVSLRWLIQSGVVAIPKAASSEHRRANLDIFDFDLDDNEMAWISHLDRKERLIDPDWAPHWDS